MVEFVKSINGLEFPPRNDQVRAKWVPIYIEPMVGSGEKITIGIAVANSNEFIVVPVPTLDRLECVYGKENISSLLYASKIAIKSMNEGLVKTGEIHLNEWASPFEGVYKGQVRVGSGKDLNEIARSAITLCSSLVSKIAEADEEPSSNVRITDTRLEALVKESVVARNTSLESAFNRQFQPSKIARSTVIGFVGNKIAANFSLLVPSYLSRQVKDAKAKLWDLAQLQEYVQISEFDLSPELLNFELLIHRVREDDPQYSERQIELITEAVNELEMEADKKDIRCRSLRSPEQLADRIIECEAA